MRQIDDTPQGPLSTTEATARTIEGGLAYLADVVRRLAPYRARAESRQRASAYLQGLLSSAERKNSWQLAEICSKPAPYGCQYLLNRADWDADTVRDELRTYVSQHLGDPNGVLVLDETGVVKKGCHSAGVARPVHRHGGQGGELPNWRISGRCQSTGPGPGGPRLCHQAADGPPDAGLRLRRRCASEVGAGR